ncbi:MAG: 30S ribosome-binding factor RbfA [Candidatus Gracilibacteria bacterium]|nr:30S ribosome-binding factor RbfA [Candidatus Gracilibacteria bacterium]
MAPSRIAKVNSFLKVEISQIIERDFRDRRSGLITVTRVDTSADMGQAKVWISVLASQIPPHKILQSLRKKAGMIHREVWHKMSAKKVPLIDFRLDENAAYVEKIEEILKELK